MDEDDKYLLLQYIPSLILLLVLACVGIAECQCNGLGKTSDPRGQMSADFVRGQEKARELERGIGRSGGLIEQCRDTADKIEAELNRAREQQCHIEESLDYLIRLIDSYTDSLQ